VAGAIVVTIAIIVPLFLLSRHDPSVLCIGDSLTYESSPALEADLWARGYSTQVQAMPGSGLLDTQINWIEWASQLIAADNPDEVVVEFIGNYGLLGAQPGIADGTPQFYERWRMAAQFLEDVLASRGAQVYWVIGPPLAKPFNQMKLTTLDGIYESHHAPNDASGRPPIINVVNAFSAPNGGYSAYLPGPDGPFVQMRLPDGIHFTSAGIARYADIVAQTLK
jgi:uncharacterized protein